VIHRRSFITLLGGAAATWPVVARGQQSKTPIIGFLHTSSPATVADRMTAFRDGLTKAGFVEGSSVTIEYRWAEGQYARLPSLAADLVSRQVDIIVAATTVASVAAKRATETIPIVFTGVGGDPVKLGLVGALNRPGGNVTGITILTVPLIAKRMEILSELVPKVMTFGFLNNPQNPNSEVTLPLIQEAAGLVRRKLVVAKASTEAEFENAFSALIQQGAGALIVDADPFFFNKRDALVALAARHSLPATYEFREFTSIGGLLSYAPDLLETYRQAGIYVGRILKGEKPSDLPVQQPIKFELTINLKTAKALGLDVPLLLQQRADEVIE
jgi:putative ABC transport system substrate-binding protein